MGKIIKKIVRWLAVIIALLIVVPAMALLLLRTPKFQTMMVHTFSDSFSKKLGTHISVDHVSFTFFNKLVLYNILITDQNQDTLLMAKQASLKIKDIKPAEQRYSIGKVEIYEPDLRMITDSTGIMNLTWYIKMLKGDREPDTTKKVNLKIADINIIDGSYSLINKKDTSPVSPGQVDFSNIRLTSLNTRIEDLNILSDTVLFSIRDLNFYEKNGLHAVNMNMKAMISNGRLNFSDIDLITDSSIINADKILLLPLDTIGFSDFINKVRLDISLKRSMLNSSDLSYFVSPLKGTNEVFYLSGRLMGTIADLRGRKIDLEYSSSTRLNCDFDISGLPAFRDAYIFMDVKDMSTCSRDIEKIRLPDNKPVTLPDVMRDLGNISFRGNFTGFITNFVAYGTLVTERGSFSTDISFKPDGRKDFKFNGLLKVSDVDLGKIAKNEKLFGGLWLHANVDGSMRSFKHLSANINGVVDSVGINNYLYRNIALAGTYMDKVWDGSVIVRDKNLKMDLLGRFDLSNTLPEFDFTMNLAHADLHELNLEKKDTLYHASALLTATFKGTNIDNLDGDLRLINSNLKNSNGEITIYDFMVRSGIENGIPVLSLRSDMADGEIRGQHTYASLGTAIKTTMSLMFPTRFKKPGAGEKLKENNFTFNARIKKVNKLSEFLGNEITIAEGSTLSGKFLADSSKVSATVQSKEIGFSGIRFMNLALQSNISRGVMKTAFSSDTLLLPGNARLDNLVLNLGSHPDTINLNLSWANKLSGKTKGEIKALGYFSLNRKDRPVLKINVLPTEMVIDSAVWNLNNSAIVLDSARTSFDNMILASQKKYMKFDGTLSSDPHEKLKFSFEGLNLGFFNSFGKKKTQPEESSLEMNFGGIINGYIALSNMYNNFLFESDIDINDFVLNSTPYGLMTIRSEWNPQQKQAVINVSNDYEGSKFFNINGTYTPSSKMTDINISTFRMPLNILNSIVKAFASDVRGVGTGKLRFYGKLNQPFLTGAIMAEDASMKVNFLQTRYSLSDSIRFTKKGVEFRNIKIYDEKKNQGSVNGMLTHNSFKNFGIDLNLTFNKMLVLNTKPKDNEIFYGTAYGTGYCGIKGSTEKLSFKISAKTENNTQFHVPLNSSETVNEYPYILFVDTKKENEAEKARDEMYVKKEKQSHLELDFDLDVTPEAEVQLIMDSKAGDVIRGTGSGKLNISLNSKGDLRMYGDYVIEDGDYLFTLGNILNKKFSVEEGGTISWNGSITDADINLKAIYRLKASLYDIYPDEALKAKIPVECQLNLSEKLMNPVVGFNIYLPTADDETREYLKSAINTEEEISRQFLYLLVMNSFYPDPSLYTAVPQQTSPQGASAIGVTTTEMLSNQLSNWLSQISNDFDIGFTYRPGNEITTQEVQVALSTQLLNDKVVLNGNFNVGGKQSSTKTSNFTGDFDAEFKITDKLKFKVFNRSNDNLFYETSPYTQGFGFFYRRDFNKLKDLFVLPDNKKKKKIDQKAAEEEK